MEEFELFKDKVAKNLIYFRKKHKLTQLELAEKINYSDKAISKWERGENIPDLYVLNQLAELYHIRVDSFITGEKRKQNKNEEKVFDNRKKFLISVMSFFLVWFVATVVFVLLGMILGLEGKWWLAFIYAIPCSMIDLLVFNTIWGNPVRNFWFVSGISWGLMISLYLSLNINNLWLMFIAGGVFQILIILWFAYIKVKRAKKG